MNEPQLLTTLKEYEGTSFIYPYTELLKLSLHKDIKKRRPCTGMQNLLDEIKGE